MANTREICVTLPEELAAHATQKVASGRYASIDDVVIKGMRSLLQHDESLEDWLRTEVVAGNTEYLADPSRGIPAETVLDWIREPRAPDRDP